MWLLGRLAREHKTIADFCKDNGLALRKVCARFVELCRERGLLAMAMDENSSGRSPVSRRLGLREFLSTIITQATNLFDRSQRSALNG
jgi:hypothetical protein